MGRHCRLIPLRVALDRGRSIEGIGRDGKRGAPAAAIPVEARLEASRGMGIVWEHGAGVVRAKTDAQGRFRLEGLAPGLHTLAARGPGLAAQRRGVALGKRTELYLFPGGGLDGYVGGPAGAPGPGGDAGPDGRFRIEKVPPGSYVLSAIAPGYGAKRAEIVVGGRQRLADVGDVALQTGLVIRGRVREAAGTAVAEARINAFRDRSMGE